MPIDWFESFWAGAEDYKMISSKPWKLPSLAQRLAPPALWLSPE
jgi:hypothetical protein